MPQHDLKAISYGQTNDFGQTIAATAAARLDAHLVAVQKTMKGFSEIIRET